MDPQIGRKEHERPLQNSQNDIEHPFIISYPCESSDLLPKQKVRLTPIGGDKKGSLGFHPAFGGGKAGPI
jgi:hypothetical protein